MHSLAESLALPLPTLPPLASTSIVTGTGTSTLAAMGNEDSSVGGSGSPWNDEEEKRFYVDLPDLRGEVPGALLKQAEEASADTMKDSQIELQADKEDDETGQVQSQVDLK
jgi:regulator of nonsense transcripts 2